MKEPVRMTPPVWRIALEFTNGSELRWQYFTAVADSAQNAANQALAFFYAPTDGGDWRASKVFVCPEGAVVQFRVQALPPPPTWEAVPLS